MHNLARSPNIAKAKPYNPRTGPHNSHDEHCQCDPGVVKNLQPFVALLGFEKSYASLSNPLSDGKSFVVVIPMFEDSGMYPESPSHVTAAWFLFTQDSPGSLRLKETVPVPVSAPEKRFRRFGQFRRFRFLFRFLERTVPTVPVSGSGQFLGHSV